MRGEPKENDISGDIVDAAYKVHTQLGPGLLESVYEAVLAHELAARGHEVERQVPIAVRYDELVFDVGFRADLLVDRLVIVELKSVELMCCPSTKSRFSPTSDWRTSASACS